jgi:hypothetical protein
MQSQLLGIHSPFCDQRYSPIDVASALEDAMSLLWSPHGTREAESETPCGDASSIGVPHLRRFLTFAKATRAWA